jgi:hypothetical protein
VAELCATDKVLLFLGKGFELNHEPALDQVLVSGPKLLLDRF